MLKGKKKSSDSYISFIIYTLDISYLRLFFQNHNNEINDNGKRMERENLN